MKCINFERLKMKKTVIWTVIACCSFSTAIAQNSPAQGAAQSWSFSLDEARQFALEHNRNIQKAGLAVKEAQAAEWAAIANYLPQTNATMSYTNYMGTELNIMARVVGRKVAPDSVKARQIVLPMGAQTRADSVLKVLRSGGDFAAIASKFSGGNPSEMGWFREADAIQLGPDFLNACFSASKNSYFSVKTKYDIRIMRFAKALTARYSVRLTGFDRVEGALQPDIFLREASSSSIFQMP